MKDVRNFKRVVQSVVLAAVGFLAVPVILLRLFGVLFFGGATSMWATVPALTLGALIAVAGNMPAKRRIIAAGLMAAYLCSILFDGWIGIKIRLDEGQDLYFDVFEAALIMILFTRCLAPFPEGHGMHR